MSMLRLKREIEAEIECMENSKKLKKSDQGQGKVQKKHPKKKTSGKEKKLSVKLCNVDYKTEKDFTKEGLEMIGRPRIFHLVFTTL
jgi:hypothetical protein